MIIKKILSLIGIKYEVKFSKTDNIIILVLLLLLIFFLVREVYNLSVLNTKSEVVDIQTQCIEQICMLKNEVLECFTLPKSEYFSVKVYRNAYAKKESYGYIFESKDKQCE